VGRPKIVAISWVAPLGLYYSSSTNYYRRAAPLGLKK
jgi:hypothetical protein